MEQSVQINTCEHLIYLFTYEPNGGSAKTEASINLQKAVGRRRTQISADKAVGYWNICSHHLGEVGNLPRELKHQR
jgi:hypothetical protein